MTESVKLEPVAWLCTNLDGDRAFEVTYIGAPWMEPLTDADKAAGWSAEPLFRRHQPQEREVVLRKVRTDVFDALRRHDVSEQCFAEVAMITHAALTTPAPAVSTDEIVAVLENARSTYRTYSEVHGLLVDCDRELFERQASKIDAILSRLKGSRDE